MFDIIFIQTELSLAQVATSRTVRSLETNFETPDCVVYSQTSWAHSTGWPILVSVYLISGLI